MSIMAYENYENNIIATYANDVARGVIDPINYDLKSKKAKRKYQEYINKIIKMKPREYFVDSFPETQERYLKEFHFNSWKKTI